MRRLCVSVFLAALLVTQLLMAQSVNPQSAAGRRVDNFVLLDQQGAAHELYYLANRRAVVIMIQGNGCPVARAAWSTLRELRDEYSGQGVEFLMLNSNLQDDRASIASEAAEFGFDIPVLVDEAQLVGESLNVIRTAEVFVIDPDGWQLVYRGPIDDRLTYERQRAEAREHYLADTLDAVLAGAAVAVSERDAVGCLVNFPHRDAATASAISYGETIAPILIDHCVDCHRTGGIAPWAMTSHRMILGFAPMIREVVRTQRMPPWHGDPHVGSWVGDRSLPPDDAAALVRWIEAGAARGDGPDPLETLPTPAGDWPLGEPDLVLTLPAFDVPATGVVDYQYPFIPNPLDETVWVRAAAITPGDRTVVHHVLSGFTTSARGRGEVDLFENYLHGYAPGMEALAFPDDTGVRVEPGGGFVFQVHYTPTGRAVTDETRLGLYFHDEPPAHILRHSVALNPQIRIEPHAPAHQESAYLPFDKDAVVYSLFPHAHYRGRSSTFEIEYPDGRIELLLSVPNYDFNWQREYVFTEPLSVPAGSKILHTTVYDNSAQNPGNPDPDRRVPWGQQSWDEMLYGAIRYRWQDETVGAPIHDTALARTQQFFGYTDRNRNDQIELAELPLATRLLLARRFRDLDADSNGSLSIEEFSRIRDVIAD